ncbi:PPR superfamily protein, putative [Medicago truncatula]|uniref:PPR superfamily protein, putative n=1 Tax=Medicago truncatula TaxID=3880 RepID=G7JW08_MEDTR|nr:PPR superfamily protein, putative [Medicago truncatula]
MGHISDIKLIRTDTTLDLSQKAEKVALQSTLILSPTALALGLGKTVHGCLLKSNAAKDISLATALLDMYSLEKKDVVMWTSMINGLAIHDHGNEAFSMFQIIHVGLVEEAQRQFNLITKRYGIVPEREQTEKLMKTMSIKPNIAIFGALLNGFQIHENVYVASQVKVRLTKLKPFQNEA